MMWVSVKERLPNKYLTVIGWATFDNECVLTRLLDDDVWWVCQTYGNFNYKTQEGVSHWQFLPEIPLELIND